MGGGEGGTRWDPRRDAKSGGGDSAALAGTLPCQALGRALSLYASLRGRPYHFIDRSLRLVSGERQRRDNLVDPASETTAKYFLTMVPFASYWPGLRLQSSQGTPCNLLCPCHSLGLLYCPCPTPRRRHPPGKGGAASRTTGSLRTRFPAVGLPANCPSSHQDGPMKCQPSSEAGGNLGN